MKVIHAVILCLEVLSLGIGYFPPTVPVTVISSIADDGEGTLRRAVESHCKCIVFDVSGTIILKSTLVIDGEGTQILGQTSPGGITITGATIEIAADNAYLSHLRVRPGAGDDPSVKSRDGIRVRDCTGATIDHCSISWSTDENLDIYRNVKRFTCRDTIISECLLVPERPHSCGALIANSEAHFSRVLFAHNNSRSPQVSKQSRVTMANVVVYNPGSQAVGIGGEANDGPIHVAASGCVMLTTKQTKSGLPFWEVKANDARVLARDCWVIPHVKNANEIPVSRSANYWTQTPPDVATLTHWKEDPRGIVVNVLREVGARPWARDLTDKRIIDEVRKGTGSRIKHESEREGSGLDWQQVTQPEEVKR
jgi:hypothetical protein